MEGDKVKIKIVYPELSYKIVRDLFDVHNELGGTLQEKHYQKAVAIKLKEKGMTFVEQYSVPIMLGDEKIGNYFFDFLIDDKIVLELKIGRFKNSYFKQLHSYIKQANLKLGILATFHEDELKFKRILNLY